MDGNEQELLRGLADIIKDLQQRVQYLEKENSELRERLNVTERTMQAQIDVATLLAKTGSPVIPDAERIDACNKINQTMQQKQASDNLRAQFK